MTETAQRSPWSGGHGPLLIAEIGGNHEGNFACAKRLTELAISSGADAVNFQLYQGNTLVNALESSETDILTSSDLSSSASNTLSLPKCARWRGSFKVGQLRCALRAPGDVRVAIVGEEMYRSSMPILSAAAQLGIPTVGVQHGNMVPAHLTYRVPRGHVRNAPIPNHSAGVRQCAKEIAAGLGAYPVASVWISGAALRGAARLVGEPTNLEG